MSFFFFNDTATTEIYTLSLHDALPISTAPRWNPATVDPFPAAQTRRRLLDLRSEEHTSELQSRSDLECRLLLEKKTTATAYLTGTGLAARPVLPAYSRCTGKDKPATRA